jgi:hypothetical protein
MPGLERLGVQHSRTFLQRASGHLWLRPIELGPKWHGLLGTQWVWCTLGTEELLGPKEKGGMHGKIKRQNPVRLWLWEEVQYGSFLSLVLFRWVAPPL